MLSWDFRKQSEIYHKKGGENMALVNKTRTYVTGDQLTADYYNDDRDEIIAGVNSIDNAQVDSGAGIEESKIAFSGSGHGHTGGSDGKKISAETALDLTGLTAGQYVKVNDAGTGFESTEIAAAFKSYAFYVGKECVVESDASFNPRVSDDLTVTKISAKLKVAPIGADLICEVRTTAGTLIATLTIPAGTTTAESTTIASPSLSEGSYLVLNVTQIGSSTAGSYLSVTLDATT